MYILFPGKERNKVSRDYHIIGQSRREANPTVLYKGNRGYLKSIRLNTQGPETNSHSHVKWEELGSQGLKQKLCPQAPVSGHD